MNWSHPKREENRFADAPAEFANAHLDECLHKLLRRSFLSGGRLVARCRRKDATDIPCRQIRANSLKGSLVEATHAELAKRSVSKPAELVDELLDDGPDELVTTTSAKKTALPAHL